MIVAPINAIPSWEGYEFQGHIALNTALKNIYDLLMENKDISLMELQIEGVEDFSIRNAGKFVSLHQVKQGSIDLKDNDKFAFIIGILQNNAEYGYFHVSTQRDIPHDFVEKTISYAKNLLKELEKKVVLRTELLNENEEDYIVVEKICINTKKSSIYNILNFVCEKERDKDSVNIAISKIKSEIDLYLNCIEKDVYERAHLFGEKDLIYLKVYDDSFDNIIDVRNFSYRLLKNIIEKVHPDWNFVNNTYCAFVYNQILLKMKDRITEFHIEQSRDGKCIISYSELLDAVTSNYHIIFDSIEYQYFMVLNCIKEMYEKYPQREWSKCRVDECSNCIDKNECNLFAQIEKLNSKTDAEREDIIHNLILMNPVLGQAYNLPNEDLINRLLLQMLDEVKLLNIEDNNVIQATKNIEDYRLSLDNSSEVADLQEKLSRELQNNSDKSFIFECDVLITNQLNNSAFLYNGDNINVLENEQLKEISMISNDSIKKIKNDCNKPKVMRLIDRTHAKGELK